MGTDFIPLLAGAVGDALGAPYEEIPEKPAPLRFGHYTPLGFVRNNRPALVGPYAVQPGCWTDDTQMTLVLAKSLIAQNEYSAEAVLDAYMQWYVGRDANAPRGVGGTIKKAFDWVLPQGYTKDALQNLNESAVRHLAHPCVRNHFDNRYCGSGTIMRAAPIGVFFSDYDAIYAATRSDAYLTHASIEAAAGSYAVALLVRFLLEDEGPKQALLRLAEDVSVQYPHTRVLACIDTALIVSESTIIRPERLRSSSDVADVLGSALALLACATTSAHVDRVLRLSLSLGGDTDTRTSILASFLGASWGSRAFPKELLAHVEDAEEILRINDRLLAGPK